MLNFYALSHPLPKKIFTLWICKIHITALETFFFTVINYFKKVVNNTLCSSFHTIPFQCFQKNNNSLLVELLEDGLIKECILMPCIVNPLTISVQSNGKIRLILGLRCVNLYVLKQRFNCEDIILTASVRHVKTYSFMISFDLHGASRWYTLSSYRGSYVYQGLWMINRIFFKIRFTVRVKIGSLYMY